MGFGGGAAQPSREFELGGWHPMHSHIVRSGIVNNINIMASLSLEKGKPRTLAYGTPLRQDLKLLEVDEELLMELQQDGCVVTV